jgi:hypothetical protein
VRGSLVDLPGPGCPAVLGEDFEGDVGDRADVLAEESTIAWGTLRAASLSLIAAARNPARSTL